MLNERETRESLRTEFPTDRKLYANNYDYEDDSDLEEDEEEDILYDELAGSPQVATEKPGDNSDAVNIGNSNAKGNESLDIVSVSDPDSLFSESSDKGEAGATSFAHVGKVVVIEDVALSRTPVSHLFYPCTKIGCKSFQALLRFLYMNEVEFAPLGSTETQSPDP